MIDIDTFWRILDEGSTPALALIALLIWRMDKTLGEFLAKMETHHESREEMHEDQKKKWDSIHSDIKAVIRKLAGLNGTTQ